MNKITNEKKVKEDENEELRQYLDKLKNELKEKEDKIAYYNKLVIEDPSIPVQFNYKDRAIIMRVEIALSYNIMSTYAKFIYDRCFTSLKVEKLTAAAAATLPFI